MQSSFSNVGPVWAVVVGLVGFVTTVFWMVVGWRAMRAHERIADTLDDRMPRAS
jgi:uncharacterized membrane protein